MKSSSKKLRNVLWINAIFSLINGLALTVFPTIIAHWMGIAFPDILRYIGIALLLFAGSVGFSASKKVLSKKEIQFIIYQDWAWVIGSMIILAFQLFDLQHLAYWLIADVAIVVAIFAFLQTKYLKVISQIFLK